MIEDYRNYHSFIKHVQEHNPKINIDMFEVCDCDGHHSMNALDIDNDDNDDECQFIQSLYLLASNITRILQYNEPDLFLLCLKFLSNYEQMFENGRSLFEHYIDINRDCLISRYKTESRSNRNLDDDTIFAGAKEWFLNRYNNTALMSMDDDPVEGAWSDGGPLEDLDDFIMEYSQTY